MCKGDAQGARLGSLLFTRKFLCFGVRGRHDGRVLSFEEDKNQYGSILDLKLMTEMSRKTKIKRQTFLKEKVVAKGGNSSNVHAHL